MGSLATYSTVLVPLNLLLLPAAEAALVNELGELLLHHLFDLGDGLLESLLRSARHMKIKRGVLKIWVSLMSTLGPVRGSLTAAVAMLLSG